MLAGTEKATAPASALPAGGIRQTITVLGPSDPDRVLAIDFEKFLDGLLCTPEPREEDLDELSAGADLLLGLEDGRTYSATYSPRAPDPKLPLAERILALTDETLDTAHRILQQDSYHALYFDTEEERSAAERMEHTLKLLDYRDDEDTFHEVCRRLLSRNAAENPSASQELL